MKTIENPTWKDTLTLTSEARAALAAALLPWEGTPYLVGQQTRGAGVDCVRFVCGVLDELYGKKTPIETLPQDAALHVPGRATVAMGRIWKLYQPNIEVLDGTIEPGDILITGRLGAGPGHAMIAGPRRWILWESTNDGVHYTGLGGIAASGHVLSHVFRPLNKRKWGR